MIYDEDQRYWATSRRVNLWLEVDWWEWGVGISQSAAGVIRITVGPFSLAVKMYTYEKNTEEETHPMGFQGTNDEN